MGNGIPPPDPIATVPPRILTAAPKVNSLDLSLLSKRDKCYQDLCRKQERIRHQKMPTAAEKAAAWKKALEAYSIWLELDTRPRLRNQELAEVEMAKSRRLIALRTTGTMKLIYRLRQKMGVKFRNLAPPNQRKLRALTAREPSSSAEATMNLRPESSA